MKFPKKLAMKTQSQIERFKQTEICKHVNLGNRRNYNEGRDEKHQLR